MLKESQTLCRELLQKRGQTDTQIDVLFKKLRTPPHAAGEVNGQITKLIYKAPWDFTDDPFASRAFGGGRSRGIATPFFRTYVM